MGHNHILLRFVLTIFLAIIFVIIFKISPFHYFISNYILCGFITWVILFVLSHAMFPVNNWLNKHHAHLMSDIFGVILGLSFSITLVPSVLPYLVRYILKKFLSSEFGNLKNSSPFALSVHIPNDAAIFVFWSCIIDIFVAIVIFMSITYFEKEKVLNSTWKFCQIVWAMLIPSIISIAKNLINIYNDSYVGTSVLIILSLIVGNMVVLDSRRISMESKRDTKK